MSSHEQISIYRNIYYFPLSFFAKRMKQNKIYKEL